MSRHARQLRAAASAYDHASPPEPCRLAEQIDHETRHDDAVIRQIADEMAQEMESEQIADLLLSHMRLHNTNGKPFGWDTALEGALRLGEQWDAELERRMGEEIESRIEAAYQRERAA